MFGDIIKVTPSSKVVGDMALMMVSQELTPEDVLDPEREIAFPQSVVEMMRGDLGQPPGGWPAALQKKVLKGERPIEVRPGSLMPDADLDTQRQELERKIGRSATDQELASYLMYPKVFVDFAFATRSYGPVSALPTPVFFWGMQIGEEVTVDIERGKGLVIRLQAIGESDEQGRVRAFFELNGQPRIVQVPDRAVAKMAARRKADEGNESHIGAPMPGVVATVAVAGGQKVSGGDILFTIEAMKMETSLHAPYDGVVDEVLIPPGSTVNAKDLVIVLRQDNPSPSRPPIPDSHAPRPGEADPKNAETPAPTPVSGA
jgi:pyruvate carboxylase